MNLSKQIKYFRKRDNLSQEELAEKIYVSRQTISNWENERSYPDIHNLLMLSVLFDTSLDDLVKGDVEIMTEKLEKAAFFKWTYMMLALLLLFPISIPITIYLFGDSGLVIPLVLFITCMFAASKVQKIKKEYNLKTYRQIKDYIEGKPISAMKPDKWERLLQIGLVLASAIFSFIVVYLGMSLLGL